MGIWMFRLNSATMLGKIDLQIFDLSFGKILGQQNRFRAKPGLLNTAPQSNGRIALVADL